MAARIDEVSRIIPAPADRLWRAWFDPAQLVHWLPPGGMTGRVLSLDPRPGGVIPKVFPQPGLAPGV